LQRAFGVPLAARATLAPSDGCNRKEQEMTLRRTIALTLTTVVTGLAATSGTASAAQFETPEATCQPRSILALPPVLYPTGQGGWDGGSSLTMNGAEGIAFRAHLAQVIGGKWVTIKSGNWKYKQVALSGDASVSYSENWFYDFSLRSWGSGNTAFSITQPGTY